MGRELFIDTSGFYSLLVERDEQHATAVQVVRQARADKRRFLTTDYVLDEAGTLLKARGQKHLVEPLFDDVLQSKACRIEWMNEGRFSEVRAFFEKHLDQSWSFTDCFSFRIMKEFRLREALSTDVHFEQAGFVALLR